MAHTYSILLVDDDEELRENLALQLSCHEEFRTSQSSDGKSGLEAVKATNFDLIILDVGLPDIDARRTRSTACAPI